VGIHDVDDPAIVVARAPAQVVPARLSHAREAGLVEAVHREGSGVEELLEERTTVVVQNKIMPVARTDPNPVAMGELVAFVVPSCLVARGDCRGIRPPVDAHTRQPGLVHAPRGSDCSAATGLAVVRRHGADRRHTHRRETQPSRQPCCAEDFLRRGPGWDHRRQDTHT
jgi:hypothetical protein